VTGDRHDALCMYPRDRIGSSPRGEATANRSAKLIDEGQNREL